MSETPSMTSVLQERLSTFGAPPSSACRGLRAALAWLGNIRPTRPPVVLSFPCLLSLFLLGASFLTGRLAWGCLQWGMLVYLSFFFLFLFTVRHTCLCLYSPQRLEGERGKGFVVPLSLNKTQTIYVRAFPQMATTRDSAAGQLLNEEKLCFFFKKEKYSCTYADPRKLPFELNQLIVRVPDQCCSPLPLKCCPDLFISFEASHPVRSPEQTQ